ncbi:MAG: peptidase C11 [Oscillospiraceae bacterium]|nr:peptidase C11 [Oscillospiraceae bacterium]
MENNNNNRPLGRKKNVTGQSAGVHRRGEGLGTGPVGNRPGGSARPGGSPGQGGRQRNDSSGSQRSSGGFGLGKLLPIIIIGAILIFGGGKLSGLFGGGSGGSTGDSYDTYNSTTNNYNYSSDSSAASSGGMGGLSDILSGLVGSSGTGSYYTEDYGSSSAVQTATSTASLDRTVAAGSRTKYTNIVGGGRDVVTLMVYMCGTDLESKSGMATSDLQEMASATLSDKVNIIVYTGGCRQWRTNGISNSVNQIYKVESGNLIRLVSDAGSGTMVDPGNLSSFIKWSAENYPADRYDLILWDHGGGSVTGYGYDEKYASAGSMDLAEINTALRDGGVKFDFVGFDACLMATAETALMMGQHADYLIASEETEPGVGWYYTDWLNALSQNTSMETIDLGQKIVDSFVDTCARRCPGQKTTLSLIDLAEYANTVPAKLTAFSQEISGMIQQKEYSTVSNARSSTREFAQSSRIDQVDLVNLANNMGTDGGQALSTAIRGAVKYNRTSSDMTNAYGVSIYFPYKKVSSLNNMVSTYEKIGMDAEYTKCIKAFASVEAAGQYVAGSNISGYGTSALPSLLGSFTGGTSTTQSMDSISSLLGGLFGGTSSSTLGGLSGIFSDRNLSDQEMAEYIYENQFDAGNLVWNVDSAGQPYITLTEDQWKLVQTLDMNMYYDDGQGYIDLGCDNVFSFDDAGNLLGATDNTWLAINGQPVAYYRLDAVGTSDDYTITGYVPALLNGDRVSLMIVFDTENPDGYIAGARYDYADAEALTEAKAMTELTAGDTLDFICDYYAYDGTYQDSYFLGEQMTVTDDMVISNVDVGGESMVTYCFTDIFGQQYWSPVMP